MKQPEEKKGAQLTVAIVGSDTTSKAVVSLQGRMGWFPSLFKDFPGKLLSQVPGTHEISKAYQPVVQELNKKVTTQHHAQTVCREKIRNVIIAAGAMYESARDAIDMLDGDKEPVETRLKAITKNTDLMKTEMDSVSTLGEDQHKEARDAAAVTQRGLPTPLTQAEIAEEHKRDQEFHDALLAAAEKCTSKERALSEQAMKQHKAQMCQAQLEREVKSLTERAGSLDKELGSVRDLYKKRIEAHNKTTKAEISDKYAKCQQQVYSKRDERIQSCQKQLDELAEAKSKIPINVKLYQYIFAVDSSGSMGGSPWEYAKKAWNVLIEILREETYESLVTLVTFATTPTVVFTTKKITEDISFPNVQPGGGTSFNPLSALLLDLCRRRKTAIPYLIVITDGDPTDGGQWTETLNNMGQFKKEFNAMGGKCFAINVVQGSKSSTLDEFVKSANGRMAVYKTRSYDCDCAFTGSPEDLPEQVRKIAKLECIHIHEINDDIKKLELNKNTIRTDADRQLELLKKEEDEEERRRALLEQEAIQLGKEQEAKEKRLQDKISSIYADLKEKELLKAKEADAIIQYTRALEEAEKEKAAALTARQEEQEKFEANAKRMRDRIEIKPDLRQKTVEDMSLHQIAKFSGAIGDFMKDSDEFSNALSLFKTGVSMIAKAGEDFVTCMKEALEYKPDYIDQDPYRMYLMYYQLLGKEARLLLPRQALPEILEKVFKISPTESGAALACLPAAGQTLMGCIKLLVAPKSPEKEHFIISLSERLEKEGKTKGKEILDLIMESVEAMDSDCQGKSDKMIKNSTRAKEIYENKIIPCVEALSRAYSGIRE